MTSTLGGVHHIGRLGVLSAVSQSQMETMKGSQIPTYLQTSFMLGPIGERKEESVRNM